MKTQSEKSSIGNKICSGKKGSIYFLFLCVIVFFSFSLNSFSKQNKLKDLNTEYLVIRKSGDFERSTVYLLDILESEEATKDLELLTWAQISLANVLWATGRLKESYSYLQLAEASLKNLTNNYLFAFFYQEYAQYYNQLGLYQLALESNRVSTTYALKIEDEDEKTRCLSYNYATRKVFHNELGQVDSALYYTYKSIATKHDTNDYTFLFKYYNKNSQRDSVEKYLTIIKGYLNDELIEPPKRFWLLEALSYYYLNTGEYQLAHEYILDKVALAEQIGRTAFLINSYGSLSKYHKAVGDEMESLRFSAKVQEYKDLLSASKSKSVELTVETLIRLKEAELKTRDDKNKLILWSSFLGFVLLVITFLWLNKKRKIKIAEIKESSLIIEREKNELSKKLLNTCDEVIELAKNNDPGFLAKFHEVYPQIFQKLESIEPSLTSEELKLCAMISLNFSTKDIANFTFVQPKTIQMKKYRLRKKIGIDSSVDLYDWITKEF